MTVDKKQREKDKWLPVKDIIDGKNPIMFSIFKERPINNAHKSAMQSSTAGLKKKLLPVLLHSEWNLKKPRHHDYLQLWNNIQHIDISIWCPISLSFCLFLYRSFLLKFYLLLTLSTSSSWLLPIYFSFSSHFTSLLKSSLCHLLIFTSYPVLDSTHRFPRGKYLIELHYDIFPQ